MSNPLTSLDRYPQLKAKEQKKIMIEELMFSQIQENLGKNIVDYVQSTRQSLQQVGLSKTRKIVLAVQKNLNKFMKGSYSDKVRLASDFYSNLKNYDRNENHFRTCEIFNPKLLDKELKKINSHRNGIQEQGALRKTLFTSSSKVPRQGSTSSILQSRANQSYSARHARRSQNIFNVILEK